MVTPTLPVVVPVCAPGLAPRVPLGVLATVEVPTGEVGGALPAELTKFVGTLVEGVPDRPLAVEGCVATLAAGVKTRYPFAFFVTMKVP